MASVSASICYIWQQLQSKGCAALADGNLLCWTDVIAAFPEAYQGNAKRPDAQWTFLASTEHPHLKTPWYMLHPCQTAELLSLMLNVDASDAEVGYCSSVQRDSDLRYFQAWYSLIAPVIRMKCRPLA